MGATHLHLHGAVLKCKGLCEEGGANGGLHLVEELAEGGGLLADGEKKSRCSPARTTARAQKYALSDEAKDEAGFTHAAVTQKHKFEVKALASHGLWGRKTSFHLRSRVLPFKHYTT